MEKFEVVTAIAVPIDESNVDTDQLCPSRFIKTMTGPTNPDALFHDRRYLSDGSPNPDFILNDPAYAGAEIIVGARNFGVGSSREGAVFALGSVGIRAVIAASMGDIFISNCFKNGLLPVRLSEDECAALRAHLFDAPGATLTIDLPNQKVAGPEGALYSFEVNPVRKTCLLEGLDDLTLTERHAGEIEAFEEAYWAELPWLAPPGAGAA